MQTTFILLILLCLLAFRVLLMMEVVIMALIHYCALLLMWDRQPTLRIPLWSTTILAIYRTQGQLLFLAQPVFPLLLASRFP